MQDARRSIPSVSRLLASEQMRPLLERWPRDMVTRATGDVLQLVRRDLAAGGTVPDEAGIAARVTDHIAALTQPQLRPVINATGVILHTNLGRAPLADAAIEAMSAVARGYSNLEYDIEQGMRGSRYDHCRALLCTLTGAEDALVVNNNAAALVVTLNTVARGREAVVSRGELVEIGGAFRVPEIMARSGARLREVGSTNRTHADDYRDAIGPRTGALLKVHPSNFTIQGYTADTGIRELSDIAHAAGLPLIHDIGSGLMVDPAHLGLSPDEPTPLVSLAAGCDVVTMSGDKLLGGPQAGIILGSTSLLERMRRNPLCRAFRVDKLTLAALAATLRLYIDPEVAIRDIPVLRMLRIGLPEMDARAASFSRACARLGYEAGVVHAVSAAGGGAAAGATIPTALVTLRSGLSTIDLERRLRLGSPAVVARIVDDRVALDLRTVPPADEGALLTALTEAIS